MNPVNFESELDTALSSRLSAESFESYANDALTALIDLVEEAKGAYDQQPTIARESSKDFEDAVFGYFKLGTVESKLAYIASLDEEIRKIGDLVTTVAPTPAAIVPPSQVESPVKNGNGTFEKKRLISRVQTLLFLLQRDLNVDIYDENQLVIQQGTLGNESMRSVSYFSLDAFPIDRTILVCNEEGNSTYIFDRAFMDEYGITTNDLGGLEKPELDDLIAEFTSLGVKIAYSSKFVSRIRTALSIPLSDVPLTNPQEAGDDNYLYPPGPDGYKSVNGIAKEYSISFDSVNKVIAAVTDELGVVEKYRMGSHITLGYSPEQQAIIYERLVALRIIVENLPDGYIRKSDFARLYEISDTTLTTLCKQLADELGEIKIYRFDARKASGFSPEQQLVLVRHLEANGYRLERPKEGFVALKEFADYLGISQRTLTEHFKDVKDLGDIRQFRRDGTSVKAYMLSPEQQQLIEMTYEKLGLLSEKPPEGVRNATDLQAHLGVTRKTIQTVISDIRDELGEVKIFKFSGKITEGFDAFQQQRIAEKLAEKGFFNFAPEGYMNTKAFADTLGVDHQVVRRLARSLRSDEAFGTVDRYKTSVRVTECYSPTQQRMIEAALKQERDVGLPDGVMNISEFAKSLALSHSVIADAFQALRDELSDIREYRHANGMMVSGLTATHRRLIKQWLEDAGRIAERVPDGFLSIKAMTRATGVSEKPLKKAIAELSEELGDVKRYKVNTTVTEAFSPTQVERVRRYLEENGYYLDEAPEGVISKKRLAKQLRTSDARVFEAAAMIESFGDIKKYRFKGNISEGFDERQRQLLETYFNRAS